MSKGLFKNLPIISYNNRLARNLMKSSKILNDAFNNPRAFTRITLDDNQSPEQVAQTYYGSIFFSWVVLLSNKIVDVYNEWPKNYKQFTDFLIQKYGSVPAAKEQILHYSNPKYGFTINQATYDKYSNTDFVDATIKVDRTGWTAVNAFDYEEERNDNLRNIQLIQPRFIGLIQEEAERIFDE